jgi:hypothetical protein
LQVTVWNLKELEKLAPKKKGIGATPRSHAHARTQCARAFEKKKNKRKSQKIDFSVALNRALVVQCNNL